MTNSVSSSSNNRTAIARVYVGSTEAARIDRFVYQVSAANFPVVLAGAATVEVTKGDVVTVRVSKDSDISNFTLNGIASECWTEFEMKPDYTVLGAVRNNEYIRVEIASGTSTVSANTYTDILGLSLDVTPGTWEIGYSALCFMDKIGGFNATRFGNLFVRDGSNNVFSESGSTMGAAFGTIGGFVNRLHSQLSQSFQINVTETTTLKLSSRCNAANTDTVMTVLGSNYTGGFTNPDATTAMWARRVK
jgi:hypothetical protein